MWVGGSNKKLSYRRTSHKKYRLIKNVNWW